jgi:hypothetical protein
MGGAPRGDQGFPKKPAAAPLRPNLQAEAGIVALTNTAATSSSASFLTTRPSPAIRDRWGGVFPILRAAEVKC